MAMTIAAIAAIASRRVPELLVADGASHCIALPPLLHCLWYTVTTMLPTLNVFLRDQFGRCSRAKQLRFQFRLPAVTLLLRSTAYQTGNLSTFRQLARDLKAENLHAITLAQTYPDVFHANVIRSRQAENEVYDAVLRLAAAPALEEAA
jgi:cobalamin biosynthesis Mg chelatase CobN